MPVEAKPLFRPDVLRSHLATFALPQRAEAQRPNLERWRDLLASGRADSFKEQELLPDFLTDIFCGLLGYTRTVDNKDHFTLSREKHVEVNGKFADAVLGDFRPGSEHFLVALEGKGPKDPLDRPFAGRPMSAVDQGYRYAINLPCDWIIVTSIRQTRLYHKGSDQYTYERFDTEALATEEALLRKFVFLLGAERVVPVTGQCHFPALLVASEKVGRELTKEFYLRYAGMRENAFDHLCQANAGANPHAVLTCTQKLLDRVLFCAFCEDRGLLPVDTIRKAYEHNDPYNPRSIWDNFRGLFRAVNVGNPALTIPAYNGGLFTDDPQLDQMTVPDEVCRYFQDLAAYDYRPAHEAVDLTARESGPSLIDVDILGHIFEQSITDLERLRNELDGLTERLGLEQHATRRKKEGAFYTPAFITRYIIEQALGGVLRDRFEQLRKGQAEVAEGTARQALANPRVYDLGALNRPQRSALVHFWEAWQEELAGIRIVDPACGSGAFLIEAFDQLHAAYEQSNDRLAELRGHRALFDLDRHILQHNLYGVDVNDEAIQICRLSLWIKTAQRGKALTSLDHTIRVGNSIVEDPAVHPRAFAWRAAFPEVFQSGGFDVVVANPPYIRQEWIAPYKPYLQQHYQVFQGTADLYVYFYELGVRVLKPGGRLSFVVTNKWLKANYGEPLRRFFAKESWVESVVDFGHAKQIFEDADVFPSILVARRPTEAAPPPPTARVCAIPREQLRINDLSVQIATEGFEIERSRLTGQAWSLEPKAVVQLLQKIRERAKPLAEFTKVKPLSGIKTGLNEAFLIDTQEKKALVAQHSACADILKPYLRGQDITRWYPDWAGLWMIALKSSGDHTWPWSDAKERAEEVFQQTYPSVHAHLKQFEAPLRKRQDQGKYWWELRSCAYWNDFDCPKIMYQEITWQLQWSYDTSGMLCNNTAYVLPVSDLWPLLAANAPVSWWFAWRTAVHGKDEALRFIREFVLDFPIPPPTDQQCEKGNAVLNRLMEIAKLQQQTRQALFDWLRMEHEVPDLSIKLQNPTELDSDTFIAEVKKLRGKKKPLTAAALKNLRDEYGRSVEPARKLDEETAQLERTGSNLVNDAYNLAAEEVTLLWETAPPRMPICSP